MPKIQILARPIVRQALLDRTLWIAIAAFTILGGLILSTLVFTDGQQRNTATVSRTLDVQKKLSKVLLLVEEAETGQRGFLLTGDAGYLKPYETATQALPAALTGLQDITRDEGQLAALGRLRLVIATRGEKLAAGIDMRRSEGLEGASRWMLTNQSRDLMDQVRREIAAMGVTDDRLLLGSHQDADGSLLGLRLLLLLGFVMLIVLAVVAMRQNVLRIRGVLETSQTLAVHNAELKAEGVHRHAAEAQVRQMQKTEALGQLTGGIAHDFNNMLFIIIGSLDIARRRLVTDPVKVEECLDQALDGAQRAASLTARLLAFSREQPLSPMGCDPNRLVGGMSDLLRQTIGEETRLETVLAGGVWGVFIDSSELENAILNLSVNARDAMASGGRLTIETSNAHLDEAYARDNPDATAGQYVAISVTDTGSGMSPAVLERAFDPFYTTKIVGKGTGLGLSQVYGFIKQSGGHIKIYSEVGRGTTITLYLPRWSGKIEPVAAPRRSVDLIPVRSGQVVLVAEDDPRVRAVTVNALEECGYIVLAAGSAAEALDLLDGSVALLFTDVVMPGMDGPQLAAEAVSRQPKLKVLYTTGYARNAMLHNGTLSHAGSILSKPFTMDQLASKVAEVLGA